MADALTHAAIDRRRPIVVVGALSLAYEGLPADLRTTRTTQAAARARLVARGAGRPVVEMGVAADLAEAVALGRSIADLDPAIVVVSSLSAIRSDLGMALVDGTSAPILVWAVQDHPSYPADYQPVDAVVGAGPVGAYALSNALVRVGRHVRCEIGPDLGPAAAAWLQAAGFAADLRDARFGLVGGLFPGMLDVRLDVARFAAELGGRWEDVTLRPPAAVEALSTESLRPFGIPAEAGDLPLIDPGLTSASCQLATALIDSAAGLDGVAVRCHSEAIGTDPEFGVMGCLGVSLLTSQGIPATCTGDMVTAVAMLFASRVGGAAQYMEVDGPDRDRGALLLSNGGELDLRSARAGNTRLVEQQFFSGELGRGLALRGIVEAGPATIVAFTETPDSWRIITLEGEVLADHLPGFPVPHAFVRSALDAADAYRRLGAAGAPHHVALAPGHLADIAAALSTLTPMEHVRL